MSNKQVAKWRRAQTVSIVTQLPLTVQPQSTISVSGHTPTVVNLRSAKITVTETKTGELIIEIEPP
jgi:hypothetical protein